MEAVSSEYELRGGARQNGKSSRSRRVLMEELSASGHVHYWSREGAWCVTSSQIGPVWQLPAKSLPQRDLP